MLSVYLEGERYLNKTKEEPFNFHKLSKLQQAAASTQFVH